ncbi:cystathionine gamma-synthase [Aliarcobacter trophiarum LMG 25534]|uniref:Cys/Met metabolism PLP-dependent enzyme n=1 Tax=Aliarcobacter trophiarum LMG 25534 TaxID=1032241 RepID=A0AAD0VMG0_9BACT|nr:aminotransferase class I/II-fold pyridoxal phosphate-dependent enzyme [Aliarcobacter trophiarum]AXK49383.1 Cys/Met metabolism PLP-dependent enzyme [Aliarcobacter trophiarum LMG 25534]RXJ92001.1 cystathionine gamma-synthase [Aliarcobacter trophiarum LMG 25534]
MKRDYIFYPINCGETLPQNNIHAVSCSMPTLKDVIDYEEQKEEILKKITVAYPRFIIHPYLKELSNYLKKKYKVSNDYELILLSSKKAVDVVSNFYYIHNAFQFKEDFGVIKVLKGRQYQKVLKFIQYVGYNLSSRLAEDYLYKIGLIENLQDEELEKKKYAQDIIISTLANAYKEQKENICLAPSGMNAIYSILKALKNIQARNGKSILIQFGWLYLDTTNIVSNYFEESKVFYDVTNLDILEEFLKNNQNRTLAIITEVPTNPLVKTANLKRLRELCDTYNIVLVIDSTFATPYNLDLKPYADIFVESLTKFACGNADVLMGAIILNSKFNISHIKNEFFKHCDTPYIKDMQRMALEIKDYKKRVKKISQNTKELIDFLPTLPYISKIYSSLDKENFENYKNLMFDENSLCGIISIYIENDFEKIYNALNFAKGPSLGTEFTLLMPYTYLAHYDLINSKKGREFLEKIELPINLIRISVGVEDINEIKKEFLRVKSNLN